MKTAGRLPSIHLLVEDPQLQPAVQHWGRPAVVAAARKTIELARSTKAFHQQRDELISAIKKELAERKKPYRKVINATGVVLHTNLGRAPLANAVTEALIGAAGYCDLETDLTSGERASRLRDVEPLLAQLTTAEAGFVVNNNAAAVLLAVAGLAGKKPTAISRGHLVEIGGGFRLPTIIEASGSPLLEIGTTNRTHLHDYEEAIKKGAGLILLVHRSNFVMTGYVAEPPIKEIVSLAKQHQIPIVLDLGSGALIPTQPFGLPHEMLVQDAVQADFDAICFSGDKLMGGPQAGFLLGKRRTIDVLRKHPLARALRCDKIQLAAVIATLQLYQRQEALSQIPIWQMLATPGDQLRQRAERWKNVLGQGEVVVAQDTVGGGTLPDASVSSVALALDFRPAEILQKRLRLENPAIVTHIENDRVYVHPRTVAAADDDILLKGLRRALLAQE